MALNVIYPDGESDIDGLKTVVDSTVHPSGIPFTPVVHDDIEPSFIKVPEELTFETQPVVQPDALIFVAKHIILFRFEQP